MNVKKTLLILGGGLAGATLVRYIYRNVQLAKQWDYSVDNFKLVEVTPNLKANMYFTIINKSNFKASVKDIKIDVFTKGKKIGEIRQSKLIDIKADGKTPLYVSISGNLQSLFKNWRDIVAQILLKKDVELDFIGDMKAKSPFGWSTIKIAFSNTGKKLYELSKEE
jgi:LEA14-like dessication related protein